MCGLSEYFYELCRILTSLRCSSKYCRIFVLYFVLCDNNKTYCIKQFCLTNIIKTIVKLFRKPFWEITFWHIGIRLRCLQYRDRNTYFIYFHFFIQKLFYLAENCKRNYHLKKKLLEKINKLTLWFYCMSCWYTT